MVTPGQCMNDQMYIFGLNDNTAVYLASTCYIWTKSIITNAACFLSRRWLLKEGKTKEDRQNVHE
jgi:hypothetical protein